MLRSNVGERGARDPLPASFPLSGKGRGKILPDCNGPSDRSRKGVEAAQYEGSRDILVWESFDLVHWTGPFPEQWAWRAQAVVWAPEAVYDDEKDAVLVF